MYPLCLLFPPSIEKPLVLLFFLFLIFFWWQSLSHWTPKWYSLMQSVAPGKQKIHKMLWRADQNLLWYWVISYLTTLWKKKVDKGSVNLNNKKRKVLTKFRKRQITELAIWANRHTGGWAPSVAVLDRCLGRSTPPILLMTGSACVPTTADSGLLHWRV